MAKAKKTPDGKTIVKKWLASKGLRAFAFQEDTWDAHVDGKSGLVNAPTGFGKTFAVFLAVIVDWINRHPSDYKKQKNNGLQLLWVTPLRALAKDIHRAMDIALEELEIPWKVGVRNGDTSISDRQKQQRSAPEILIITPESLHLLIATKNHEAIFQKLTCIAVDEWHELLGTKRGVQVELAVGHLKGISGRELGIGNLELGDNSKELGIGHLDLDDNGLHNTNNEKAFDTEQPNSKIQSDLTKSQTPISNIQYPVSSSPSSQFPIPNSQLRIWAISATIGNLEEAMQVILGDWEGGTIIKAALDKKISINTILPDKLERFPWAGHLGVRMISFVLPVIYASKTTLLFTNVRSAAEMWYQSLLAADPDLAGVIALHHSAIDGETRAWVEEQLHLGTLKVVVCTSSLDLGVDFRPVDTVIQVGSPKGVARFLQRAGRSGHSPDAISNIYFVPTHSLEILEAIALKRAYERQLVERRNPVLMAWDVLIQYMVTRAVGDGFKSEELYVEIISSHSFADVTWDEWEWLLAFITTGGSSLNGYDEYHKVVVIDGVYKVTNRRIAMNHRMNMGTIVGDVLMRVRFLGGGFVGTIEENFISMLKVGDSFILAGKRLELVAVKDMDAIVKKSTAKNAIIPSWNGGRLPLSANLGEILRQTYQQSAHHPESDPLFVFMQPLLDTQKRLSAIPEHGELLIELIDTRDGYHMFCYPYEGRLVHQAMAALLAYRLSKTMPISFSIAMNDYGFELLSDQPLPINEETVKELFNPKDWYMDLQRSVNATELARRKFRDIAVIAGLIHQGAPGHKKRQRHLQNSTSLIYEVLRDQEPNHLLLTQAYNDVLAYEVEAERLYLALERLYNNPIQITRPTQLTPFCFPIKVDSLREQLTSEKLEDRIKRMQAQLEKA